MAHKFTEEEKLKIIKEYLESNLSLTQFCNTHSITRSTIYAWLNWYNEKKDVWQVATTGEKENDDVKEITPIFKETNQKIDDQEFHQYRTITVEFKSTKITCDKSTFKDIWRVIRGD